MVAEAGGEPGARLVRATTTRGRGPWSPTRRGAARPPALSACSSSGMSASSAGSAGSGPAGARSASGPSESADLGHRDARRPARGRTAATCRWSFRCLPTSGASSWHATPAASSSRRGPMPESIRMCGEPMAPALSTTSLSALTTRVAPSAVRYSTPRRLQRAGVTVEEHSRHLRAGDDRRGSVAARPRLRGTRGTCSTASVPRGGLQQRHDAVGPPRSRPL